MYSLRLASSLLILAFLVAACPTGFYKVDNAPNWNYESQTTAPEDSYVRVKADLANENLINSKELRGDRDSDLVYLYVSAEYDNPPYGKTKIPLYSVDLNKGSIDSSVGATLVDLVPISATARGSSAMVLRVRALESTNVDKFRTALKLAEPLLASARDFGIGAQISSTGVTAISGILDSFASSEHQSTLAITIPANMAVKKAYYVHYLYPTDSSSVRTAEAQTRVDKLSATSLTTCEGAGRTYLCYASGTEHAGKRVELLPYIIFTLEFVDYYSPSYLTSIDKQCNLVTRAQTTAARTQILSDAFLTSDQRKYEMELLTLAESLLDLRDALYRNDYTLAAQAIFTSVSLQQSASSYWTTHYADRANTIRSCIKAQNKMPSGPQIYDVAERFVSSPDLQKAAIGELNTQLSAFRTFLALSQRQEVAFLRGTSLAQLCGAKIAEIESAAFERFFSAGVQRLAGAKSKASDLDQLAAALESEVQSSGSSCQVCVDRVSAAINAYRAVALQGELARALDEKTQLLAQAAKVKSELEAARLAASISNDPSTTARVEAAQRAVSTNLATYQSTASPVEAEAALRLALVATEPLR